MLSGNFPDLPPEADHGEWAMRYAEAGLAVFPCAERDKHPLTDHGVKAATTDLDQVQAWWVKWPRANVAIACGRPSSVFVIDADIDKSTGERIGQRSFDQLIDDAWRTYGGSHGECLGHLHGRWKVDTPSGGFHWYHQLPDLLHRAGLDVLTRSPDAYPKIDIRSTGAYVIAPPSVHPTGGRYCWCGPWNPLQVRTTEALHPALASHLRDLGVIDRPDAAGGPAIDLGAIGKVVEACSHRRLIEAIVAATPPLVEGQQHTRTVHDHTTRQQVRRTTAGRDEYLAFAVAYPVWNALEDVHAADTLHAQANPDTPATSNALATLIDAVKRANARLGTPLTEMDVLRIARSAARKVPTGPREGTPRATLTLGGKRQPPGSTIDLQAVAATVAAHHAGGAA